MLTRRDFLQATAATSLFSLLPRSLRGSPAGQDRKPNVLFLMADDWNTWMNCYGHEQMVTPNVSKIAAQGVVFKNNFCQFPVCNPSRTSLLTGRYPNTTMQIFNGTHHFRDIPADANWVTLPGYFKANGYVTLNAGKIFHGKAQDPGSWTEWVHDYIPPGFRKKGVDLENEDNSVGQNNERYHILDGNGESHVDYWIADSGIKLLNKYKDKGQPFFLGVGFHCPHALPTAPKRFYDLYPPDEIKLPPDFAAVPTVPPGCPATMLPAENDPYMKAPVSPEAAREVIRAYRAADSYVDWNMGRVIDELNQQGLADNTIIVILSDHGYHNGEKGRFGKTSSFDIAQQVPLIIYVPGAAGNGKTCYRTVQSLDLYPTLAALCGLPAPPGVQGNDISSLVHDPAQEWSQASYSMSRTGGTIGIGYTVRTENYCYTEWNGGKAGQVLFDRKADPLQTRNLAPDPSHAQTVAEMKGLLVQKFGTNMPVRIPATEPAYVKAHHLT